MLLASTLPAAREGTATMWEEALGILRKQLPASEFRRWFAPTESPGEDGGSVVVRVPGAAFAERLRTYYGAHVRDALERVGAGDFEVRFILGETPDEAVARAPQSAGTLAESEPVSDRCTFGSFVVGAANRSAWAAAREASEPGTADSPYNPLLIHGDVGVGKTHLLQAIAARVRRESPRARVLLTRGESFTRQVVHAVRSQELYAFRDQCRRVDMLLVDDVQFLAGLDRFGRTTEEFFHTLNALTDRGRQVVLTANAHPQELTAMDPRIRTRLAAGLTADMGCPDWETRVSIVRRRADEVGAELPRAAAELIASRVRHNVRALVGAVNQIVTAARVHEIEITKELASDVLVHGGRPSMTISQVLVKTASEFGFAPNRLRGPQRQRDLVLARHVAMFLCREMTRSTLTDIGRAFNRDHSTVSYSVKRVEDLRGDPGLERVLERLERQLR